MGIRGFSGRHRGELLPLAAAFPINPWTAVISSELRYRLSFRGKAHS